MNFKEGQGSCCWALLQLHCPETQCQTWSADVSVFTRVIFWNRAVSQLLRPNQQWRGQELIGYEINLLIKE
jgi:hypothetical protein